MPEPIKESVFVRRLGAATAAAWWTFLVAVVIVIVQSFAYMAVAHCGIGRTWLSNMMGMDWGTLRDFICEFILVLRMIVLLMLLGCIFLSLWARRLRRRGDA
jgi:hypothetical protein